MLKRTVALAALAGAALAWAGPARGDEIVFKKEFGGGKVKCEIYKEDDDYVHYVDVEKKMASGAAKEIIEKIVRQKKPLIDVEAFFLKKAKEAKGKAAREKAAAIAAELRKAREAAEKAAKTKKVGKLKMRPMTSGVKLLPARAGESGELLVDPFPEEEGGPNLKKKSGKKGAKK